MQHPVVIGEEHAGVGGGSEAGAGLDEHVHRVNDVESAAPRIGEENESIGKVNVLM